MDTRNRVISKKTRIDLPLDDFKRFVVSNKKQFMDGC